jgi:hypothetical protein
MLLRIALVAAAAVMATSGIAGQDQSADERPVSLSLPGGSTATGVLRVPAAMRSPVVCLVTDGDAGALAAALGAEGIASLRLNAKTADLMAMWISYLRNDERFPLVTVFAEGSLLTAGVVAARAARADGIVTRGDKAPASAELSRVVAAVTSIDATATADAARQIATFARSVPALGRRGNPSPARTVARRSPRQTAMATIGGVHVAIEWGQPQMRGRNIWGEIVPWGKVWMPGADEATVLTTDAALTIGDINVPAGDHTIYTLPAADRAQLLISRDVGQFHTVYDEALVIGRTDMNLVTKTDRTEGLTFAIRPAADGQIATLALIWAEREYVVTVRIR